MTSFSARGEHQYGDPGRMRDTDAHSCARLDCLPPVCSARVHQGPWRRTSSGGSSNGIVSGPNRAGMLLQKLAPNPQSPRWRCSLYPPPSSFVPMRFLPSWSRALVALLSLGTPTLRLHNCVRSIASTALQGVRAGVSSASG